MIKIINAENEKIKGELEQVTYKHIYEISFYNGIPYKELRGIKEITQDNYIIIHDTIAEVFYSVLNGSNYCYTSTSSLAGHHNMEQEGTLIFWCGQCYYVTDDKKSLNNIEDN